MIKPLKIEQYDAKKELGILILAPVLLISFLFFIDEGNYNFDWATSASGWIIFLVFAFPVFVIQLLIFITLPKRTGLITRRILSIVFGFIVGITSVLLVIS